MPSLIEEFGRLVRHHRRQAHLTQEQLAERVGLSIEMIGRIERGEVGASFDSISKLAEVLNVPVRDLFGAGSYSAGKRRSGKLGTVVGKLVDLKPDELTWIDELLDVAIKRLGR